MSGLNVHKSEHERTGRERTGMQEKMSGRQIFWGVLMVLSLLVMFAAAVPAANAAGGGQREAYAGNISDGRGTAAENAGPTVFEMGALAAALYNAAREADVQAVSEDGNGQQDAAAEDEQDTAVGDEKAEDGPVVALTFDDGPFTKVTNRILDVLLEYDAGATFFIVGSRIDMYSDTLTRIYENGFEVANHTWSHANLNNLSEEEILKEIADTTERLNYYVPVGSVLLRPPYGNANETVRGLAGTALINWSLDSEDWKSRDTDTIIEHVLETVKDGDIILMHDLYECTAEAVEYLVPELIARGYRLVSVSELFCIKGIPLEEGVLYRNPQDHY